MKSGFTLIELLIVISIIAFLALIGFFLLGDKIKRGRDAQRRSEIQEIRNGLEAYFSEQNVFPDALSFNGQPLIGPGGQIDLPRVHHDPLNRDPYLYTYWATPAAAPQSFILCAYRLETQTGSYCLQNIQQ